MSVDFLSKNFPPFQVHHAKKPPRFYPDGFQRNVIDFYFIFSDCRLRKALYLQFSYFIWPLWSLSPPRLSQTADIRRLKRMGRRRLRKSGEWTGAACFRLTAVSAATPPCLTDSERPAFPQHGWCPSPEADRCGERASNLQYHSVMWPRFAPS